MKQYSIVVLSFFLCNTRFEYADEILKCDRLNDSHWVAPFCGTIRFSNSLKNDIWIRASFAVLAFSETVFYVLTRKLECLSFNTNGRKGKGYLVQVLISFLTQRAQSASQNFNRKNAIGQSSGNCLKVPFCCTRSWTVVDLSRRKIALIRQSETSLSFPLNSLRFQVYDWTIQFDCYHCRLPWQKWLTTWRRTAKRRMKRWNY